MYLLNTNYGYMLREIIPLITLWDYALSSTRNQLVLLLGSGLKSIERISA